MPEGCLRILIVEDNAADVRLVLHELRQFGLVFEHLQAQTEDEFVTLLQTSPDIILCDYNLPQFNALQALRLLRERQSDIPLLIVSGSIGEETAVEAMKQGATDYVLKDRMGRLGQAVRQAIEQQTLQRVSRKAEEAIRESETRLQLALDSAGMGVWEWNIRTNAVFWSPECFAILGVEVFAGTFEAFARHVHPDDLARLRLSIDTAIAQKRAFSAEFRVSRPDQSIVWLTNFGRVMCDAAGPAKMLGVVQDITERKQAEEALRVSEKQYRVLAESIPQIVWTAQPTGELNYLNDRALVYSGLPQSELVGWGWAQIVHPDDRELAESRWKEALQAGEPRDVEFRLRRSDGEYRWHIARQETIRHQSGAVVRWLGTCTDVHDQKRNEASLEAVMRSVSDAIITIDQRGTIRSVNSAVEKTFGYSADELLGQSLTRLMPDSGRPPENFLDAYLKTGVSHAIGAGREVSGRRRDGSEFPADLSVTEFQLEGTRHFTGVLRDVTERKRLEEQYRQSQKMEAVGRLAGGVAHDFNNLLTVINGYSDMLVSELPETDVNWEPLAAIRDAGERAARLTSQLLAFSRKAIIDPRQLDLNEVVDEISKLLRRLIGEDVVLRTVLSQGLQLVNADHGQIEQLIINMAANARDSMPRGGQLTIQTSNLVLEDAGLALDFDCPPGSYVCLSVADTGAGMSEEVKARIFEPFFTTKGLGNGTGLGLATVYGFVKQSGGHIAVASELGQGTTFTVLLPAIQAPTPRPAALGNELPPNGTETVMLVEDEDVVRRLARLALEAQGYHVLDAPSAADALLAADAHPGPIHLLLTDVVMPEIGGRELADAFRQRRPEALILYMSGYMEDSVVRHGVVQATDAFIQKPFTPAGLAKKVRAVIDARPIGQIPMTSDPMTQ